MILLQAEINGLVDSVPVEGDDAEPEFCPSARREGETLILTYEEITIELHVTDIKGGQVKLGVEAPLEVEVVREEIVIPNRDHL